MINEINKNTPVNIQIEAHSAQEERAAPPDNPEGMVRNEKGPWTLWGASYFAARSTRSIQLETLNHGIGYWNYNDLHSAIAKNDVALARSLIEQASLQTINAPAQFPTNQWYREQNTYLYNYKAFLERGASPMQGPAPLALAVLSGSLELARLLLEKGADVNARFVEVVHPEKHSIEGRIVSPLALALIANDLEMTDLLLSFGAHSDQVVSRVKVTEHLRHEPGFMGGTTWATYSTDIGTQSLILLAGNDAMIRSYLHQRTGKRLAPEQIPQAVIDTFKLYETSQYPALHNSILKGNVEAFWLLLEYGADANASHPVHPIDLALDSPNPLFLEKLIGRIASEHVPEKLILAAQKNALTAVMGLLAKQVPLTPEQTRRLYQAAFSQVKDEIARHLLLHGVHHPELLLLAVESSKPSMLDLLLMYRAFQPAEIETALQHALKQQPQNLNILERLFTLRKS